MAYFTSLDIGGTSNIQNMEQISINNSSTNHTSSCNITLPNDQGAYASSFVINDDVDIYLNGPWLSGWRKRIKITIDNGDVDSNLTEFPILIHLSTSSGINSDDVSAIFDELTSDANRKKIAVTSSDAMTELYVEIEKWDDGNEEAWLWVKVPSISSSSDTELYFYYDSAHADNTDFVGDTNSEVAENVWDDNFVFVSHMADDPDTSNIRDSTSNDNDGAKLAAGEPAVSTSGKIGDCQNFDGTDDRIDITSHVSLNMTDRLTLECWFNDDDDPKVTRSVTLTKGRPDAGDPIYFFFLNASGDDIRFGIVNDAATAAMTDGMAGNWFYLAGTFDKDLSSNQMNIYLNSVLGTPDTRTTACNTTADPLVIGNNVDSLGTFDFDGRIDEVRVSNIARPAAWIKATYETQRDHMLTFDAEEISQKIFKGLVNNITFHSVGSTQRETIQVDCLDYAKKLKDISERAVYTDLSCGSIIKSIFNNTEITDVTTNNVQDGPTIEYINFKHRPVIDCVVELAEIARFDWWVDTDQDLHFVSQLSESSGKSLEAGSNITNSNFREDESQLFNTVQVYGGRRLVGVTGSETADGPGSVYTLEYKPHNTTVKVNGVLKKGGVKEMFSAATSGVEYLVDFDQKQIVFVSGTSAGDNIPASGTTWTIDYQRQVPVIKPAFDTPSVGIYGIKEKVIINEEILDPRMASRVAYAFLNSHSKPRKVGTLNLQGEKFLEAGKTAVVNVPFVGVNNQTMKILDVNYSMNQDTLRGEEVMTVKVGEQVPDVTDVLRAVVLDIKKLQASRVEIPDVVSRAIAHTGSLVPQMNWTLKTRSIGHSFILGHPINGQIGTTLGVDGSQVWLGDYRGGLVTVDSGGQF